jgi:elongation factor Tu
MDEHIPIPTRDVDKNFLMAVDGAFNIAGRGTVATGTIEEGKCKVGEDVQLVGLKRKATNTTIIGVETFKKTLDYGEAGDNVGILLRGVNRNDVNRGMCLVKPGTLDVFRNFDAEIYILKEEEGGRKKPFYTGYTPQVIFPYKFSALLEQLMLLLKFSYLIVPRWPCQVITLLSN